MVTWLVLSSSCGRNGIRLHELSSNLTRHSPRSTATHTEDELQLGARFQRQHGRESRLPSEHDQGKGT